jgi:hypothetical protein
MTGTIGVFDPNHPKSILYVVGGPYRSPAKQVHINRYKVPKARCRYSYVFELNIQVGQHAKT